ncbi:MAG: radical SAM protein [Planctomycetes bacterium]|nr:radical SAM protein [Planctomycetota bacterium]
MTEPAVHVLRGLLREGYASHRAAHAFLELTYRCNLDCAHCYCIHDQAGEELSTVEWCRVMGDLAAMGVLYLSFTGGEVFVRRDFLDLAAEARRLRFAWSLLTNAAAIDEGRADRLAALRPCAVAVSLYGATEATYRAVTGRPGGLERARRGVGLLVERGLRVHLRAPVTRRNAHELEAMIAMAAGWGLGLDHDPDMTAADDGGRGPLAEALDGEALAAYLARYRGGAPAPVRAGASHVCGAGQVLLAISPFGDLLPCVAFKRPVGNLRRTSLAELWAGSPFLAELRSLRVRDLEGGGAWHCPGAAWAETGDPTRQRDYARRRSALAGAAAAASALTR